MARSRLSSAQASLGGCITPLNLYVAAVCGAGVPVLVMLARQGIHATPWGPFVALIVASSLADAFPIIVPWRDQNLHFSVGSTFGFALLILYGIPAAALVHAVLWFVVHSFQRMAWKKVLFNSAQITLSFTVAGGVLNLLATWSPGSGGGLSDIADLGRALVAVAVFHLTNQVFIGAARFFSSTASLPEIVSGMLLVEGRVEWTCLVIAPVVAAAAQSNPLLILLLLAPIAGFNTSIRYALQNVRLLDERRKALEDQKATEERFRSMIQNSSDVICLLDGDGKFIYVSPSVKPQMGYSPAELLHTDSAHIVHPDDIARQADALTTALRSPSRRKTGRWRMRTSNGGWIWMECTLENMLADSAVGGIVVNCRDITEARELEEQLRQSQKLEAIGQLAGGVAHDFNNLLSVIQNFTQFAKDELPEDEAIHDDLDAVLKAAEQGAALNRQLLAFSRKEVIQPKILSVNEVMSDIAKLLRRTLRESILLDLRLAPSVGFVEIDPMQLEQVLVNLAINAKDAMPSGGTLTIETSAIRDEDVVQGRDGSHFREWIRVTVADTGHGMDDETKQRIFEPFFTTKSRAAGTGLGLSTVYGIVQQARGRIRVESQSEAGTRFLIDLPAADAAEAIHETEPAEPAPQGAETVLVVEDEKVVAFLVERILTANGYKVLRAPSPERALDIAYESADAIDVLLTDVVMPGMSGRELADAISALGIELKVLYMSGYAQDIIGRHGVLAEDENYLQKPFSGNDLLRSIRTVVDETPVGTEDTTSGPPRLRAPTR